MILVRRAKYHESNHIWTPLSEIYQWPPSFDLHHFKIDDVLYKTGTIKAWDIINKFQAWRKLSARD